MRPKPIARREYTAPSADQNLELLDARRSFINFARDETPNFLAKLRLSVLPVFTRLQESGANGWQPDWSLETWEELVDHGGELRSELLVWACSFHVQHEPWILEGALRTLARWHQHSEFAKRSRSERLLSTRGRRRRQP